MYYNVVGIGFIPSNGSKLCIYMKSEMTELDGGSYTSQKWWKFSIGCLAYEIVAPKSISYKSWLVNFNNKIGTIGVLYNIFLTENFHTISIFFCWKYKGGEDMRFKTKMISICELSSLWIYTQIKLKLSRYYKIEKLSYYVWLSSVWVCMLRLPKIMKIVGK